VYESLKLVIVAFLLPPGGPLILIVLGVLMLSRRPRAGRALCAVGAATLWLLALPVVSGALATALGGGTPLDPAAARGADAIVILGGGVRERAAEYGGDTLGRLTLERTRYGARLARMTGLPVLVTGGSPKRGVQAEGSLMADALALEFGVQVSWADDLARNTRENAANAAKILLPLGKRRIVLVMHGFDVRRAAHQFKAAGFEVLPAPTQMPRWGDPGAGDFLPSVGALYVSHYALYEFFALAREAAAALQPGQP